MFAYGFVVGHRGSWSHLCSNHMFCVCVCVWKGMSAVSFGKMESLTNALTELL